VLSGEAAHRLDLALAVDERSLDVAGQGAVGGDLVARADTPLEPEHVRQQLDERVRGGADDERRAARVLVRVDLVHHLRVDPRQDPGEQVGSHARDVLLGDPPEQVLDEREHGLRALVGRTVEAEAHVVEPPGDQLAAAHHPRPVRGAAEVHRARPRHQGPV
jgi:hypothetical protein